MALATFVDPSRLPQFAGSLDPDVAMLELRLRVLDRWLSGY